MTPGQLLQQGHQSLANERVQLAELGRHVGQRRQTVGVQVLVLVSRQTTGQVRSAGVIQLAVELTVTDQQFLA